jgi:hypothetical protein
MNTRSKGSIAGFFAPAGSARQGKRDAAEADLDSEATVYDSDICLDDRFDADTVINDHEDCNSNEDSDDDESPRLRSSLDRAPPNLLSPDHMRNSCGEDCDDDVLAPGTKWATPETPMTSARCDTPMPFLKPLANLGEDLLTQSGMALEAVLRGKLAAMDRGKDAASRSPTPKPSEPPVVVNYSGRHFLLAQPTDLHNEGERFHLRNDPLQSRDSIVKNRKIRRKQKTNVRKEPAFNSQQKAAHLENIRLENQRRRALAGVNQKLLAAQQKVIDVDRPYLSGTFKKVGAKSPIFKVCSILPAKDGYPQMLVCDHCGARYIMHIHTHTHTHYILYIIYYTLHIIYYILYIITPPPCIFFSRQVPVQGAQHFLHQVTPAIEAPATPRGVVPCQATDSVQPAATTNYAGTIPVPGVH